MKKTITIVALSTMLYFIPGWNGIFAQYPLDFTAYASNPVMTHGDPGSFDGDLFINPYALWHDGVFYLYYTGNAGIGLATSADGYNFTKSIENPVFTTSPGGFDSYQVTGPVLLETGSAWVMYYNSREQPGWGPGQFIGRATSNSLTGSTWERSADPVMEVGTAGEWDAGFICPHNVFPLDTGGFIMFYSASDDINYGLYEVGMATSPDGITWTKYNDPSTAQPPYADSDPVLKVGDPGAWDDETAAFCCVLKKTGHYEMYYSGMSTSSAAIGYASSVDGITWEKWPFNPVYLPENDPYAVAINSLFFELPNLLVYNETVFMYYDYGVIENSIGMATADVWVGSDEKRITNYELRIMNSPNPVYQSTTFSYTLKEPGQVKLEIFDSFGRLIDEPLKAYQQKGEQRVSWNAEAYPAGIYYYRIQAGKEVGGGKVVVE
jgi:predicted GH43/DUF377 family glycosyl hydrolase